MTESEFQEQIIELAHVFGWRIAHFRPAQTKHGWRTPVSADGKGWPDLVLVHAGSPPIKHVHTPAGSAQRVLFRELKSESGQLSSEQLQWGDWLTAAGADWQLWRPSMLDEYIVPTLTFGRAVSVLGAQRAPSEQTAPVRAADEQPESNQPTGE
jgi:hypothetical protein